MRCEPLCCIVFSTYIVVTCGCCYCCLSITLQWVEFYSGKNGLLVFYVCDLHYLCEWKKMFFSLKTQIIQSRWITPF